MQIKSTVARLLGAPTDPVDLIKQSIRELEDQVPVFNEELAMLKAQVRLSEKDLAQLRDKDAELSEKIADAWERERPEVAANYALTQDEVRREASRRDARLTLARGAFQRAQRVKRAFMNYKEETIKLAKEALDAQRQAAWNRKVVASLCALQRGAQIVSAAPEPAVEQLRADADRSQAELHEAFEGLLEVEDLSRDELNALVGVTRGELRNLGGQLAAASARLDRLEERLSSLDG